jgi:hypothetical protein
MKTIQILTVLFFTSLFSIATDFGSGPSVYARAYESVQSGSYNVWGEGLKSSFTQDIFYGDNGVKNSAELIGPLQGMEYALRFTNCKSPVYEQTVLRDKYGNTVFVSDYSWKPIESMSTDGKSLSYSIPAYAGAIYLQLADRMIECDSDFVEVQLENGQYITLEVFESKQILVPGWIYSQKGVFIEWKKGSRKVTDIQTGLVVRGGIKILRTHDGMIDGITTRETRGLYLSVYSSQDWDTTFETIVQQTGNLNLWVGDSWNNAPQGVYITNVGSKMPAVYYQPDKDGMLWLPVEAGQTLHLKPYWGANTGGKG